MVVSLLLGGVTPRAHATVCVADTSSDTTETVLVADSPDDCCEPAAESDCCDSDTGCQPEDGSNDEPCSDQGCDCPSACCVKVMPVVTTLPISMAVSPFDLSTRATEFPLSTLAHGYQQDITWPPIA